MIRNDGKIALTRLYRKVSARTGEQYFVGRLGAARVLLFKDRDQLAEGDEVFSLLIEAVEDASAPRAEPQAAAPPRQPRRCRSEIMQAFDRLDERFAAMRDDPADIAGG